MYLFGIKGTNKVDKILNDFLKPFDVTAHFGDGFYYYPTKNEIEYTLEILDRHANSFMIFVNKLAPDIVCDVFLISFLHELGHHETCEDYEEEYPFSYMQDEYNRLSKAAVFCASSEEQLGYDLEYYNLPWEKGATEWGLNYIREHRAEIADLWNRLSAAIQEVYKLNNMI